MMSKSASDDRVISCLQIHGDAKQSSIAVLILFLGFATIIGPAITGPHLMTLVMDGNQSAGLLRLTGYHFPWSLSNFLPLYGGKLKALKKAGVEDDGEERCNGKEM